MKVKAASSASAMRWPGGGSKSSTAPAPASSGRAARENRIEVERGLDDVGEPLDESLERRCSRACTRPRWRSGNAMSGSRRMAPSTAMSRATMPSRACASCRSLATWLSTTPAICTCGSKLTKPCAIAAAVCDWPDTSSTSSTGNAVAPRQIGGGARAPASRRARRRTGPSRFRSPVCRHRPPAERSAGRAARATSPSCRD